jgi:DNA/RNA-binding domain of Phe-tRNA-synthetase-like protein
MLLEMPYKVGDTVSIKLASGEEIIANLKEETGESIVIEKPLTLVAQQQGIGLAPFMFTASPEAKLTINTKNVLCVTKTIEEMAKQYLSNTSGIAVA